MTLNKMTKFIIHNIYSVIIIGSTHNVALVV